MNAKLKACVFVVLFSIIGVVMVYRNFNLAALPLVLFYVVLMVNTYFSIEFFSKIIPLKRPDQKIIDLLLVFSYLALILSMGNEIWYLLFAIMLFVVATLKYVCLLGVVDLKILKKKLIVNIFAIVACILAFGGYLIDWGMIIWIWGLMFLFANVYLLIIKPMYKFDK
jgi:hypothetical protein